MKQWQNLDLDLDQPFWPVRDRRRFVDFRRVLSWRIHRANSAPAEGRLDSG